MSDIDHEQHHHDTSISDEQFLKSMIPHHGAAVLMCEEAAIQKPAIIELCGAITSSQLAEIRQMKELLQVN